MHVFIKTDCRIYTVLSQLWILYEVCDPLSHTFGQTKGSNPAKCSPQFHYVSELYILVNSSVCQVVKTAQTRGIRLRF